MSAVEEIQAAIDKLTELKAECDYSEMNGWLVEFVGEHTCAGGTVESNGMHERGCGYQPLTSDPLIVTLHRTIDALLAILNKFAEYGSLWMEESAMALAKAINGGTE